jgi:predicted RNA binding protein YcfA (HicA-like mRNA interferase family)
MGTPVTLEEFKAAMKTAGFAIASQRGSAIFYAARDTVSKRQYVRRKFLLADDTTVHPLLETG